MQKHLVTFAVVFLAVLGALFVYDQIRNRPSATGADFGAGEIRARNNMILSDVQRGLSPAKTAVAEYYMNRGDWSRDNEATGLPPPDQYRGESLRRLEVSGNRITLTFDARSDVDGGLLVYTGDASNLAMGVSWTCSSPNIDYIATVLPNCVYGAGK